MFFSMRNYSQKDGCVQKLDFNVTIFQLLATVS